MYTGCFIIRFGITCIPKPILHANADNIANIKPIPYQWQIFLQRKFRTYCLAFFFVPRYVRQHLLVTVTGRRSGRRIRTCCFIYEI